MLAGLLLGLAAGCRITAGALALPLCLWLLLTPAPRSALRQCLAFAIALLAAGGLCFLAVWRRYGADFFSVFDNGGSLPLDVIATRALSLVWG
jgi:hypothetical protein